MRFKSKLLKLAKHSCHHSYMHSAIVAKGNAILSEGINDNMIHAEADALVSHLGVKRLTGATLYTLMVRRKSGTIGNGAPCNECMSLIRQAGIKRVVVYDA